ncbi:inner membrane ABC transporter permease ydcU [Klebsiella pneumoniae MGH 72]|nr:inner membrane ABC transporter permease ydcU [Klebsiella pneumoniae MGH 72]
MTMAIIPAQTGRISGIFWRRPALGLFLLLLGPLMWFGIVYLGSLLTLLWQSIYTFDDFTMSVTSDFTLANLRALFNPANYDIIVRTLVMALCVTLASALLALPMAWYWARRDTLSAIWFTRSRGRSAICRWRRRLPWCLSS